MNLCESPARFFLAALLSLSALAPAMADGAIDKIITAADRERLAKYEATRLEALNEAKAGGDAGEYANLQEALSKPAIAFNDIDLTGEWQCRTTKAGGLSALVVYSWFRCRVTDDGSGWMLEKLSGSQRTTGRFYTDSDTRLTYLGALSYNNDPAPKYGVGPETDQAGYAFAAAPNAWRIEFPAPAYESKLDILEFRR